MDSWGGNGVPDTEMDTVATETMFQEYEREVRMLFEKVQEEMYTIEAGGPSDKAESMMGEISQNRRALQIRIRTDRSLRSRWTPMLEEWDQQLSELRKTLKSFQERNRRSDLFDARLQAAMQIKKSEDRLEEGTTLLENAHRQIVETESIGHQITGDLASQREVLLHARSNMGVVRGELATASTMIKDIFRIYRMNKYSTVIALTVVALLFLIAFYCIFWGGTESVLPRLPSPSFPSLTHDPTTTPALPTSQASAGVHERTKTQTASAVPSAQEGAAAHERPNPAPSLAPLPSSHDGVAAHERPTPPSAPRPSAEEGSTAHERPDPAPSFAPLPSAQGGSTAHERPDPPSFAPLPSSQSATAHEDTHEKAPTLPLTQSSSGDKGEDTRLATETLPLIPSVDNTV